MSKSYDDIQASRIVVASIHFGVHLDGYYQRAAKAKLKTLKNGSAIKRRNTMQAYMGGLTRLAASKIEAAADATIQPEINDECARLALPSPKVDGNWLDFVVRGVPVRVNPEPSQAEVVANNIINGHMAAINKRISLAPKKQMKPVRVKA